MQSGFVSGKVKYRFGYPDDEERSVKETADHFSIRAIWAEKIEAAALAAFRKGLPWGKDVSEADYMHKSGELHAEALVLSTVSF